MILRKFTADFPVINPPFIPAVRLSDYDGEVKTYLPMKRWLLFLFCAVFLASCSSVSPDISGQLASDSSGSLNFVSDSAQSALPTEVSQLPTLPSLASDLPTLPSLSSDLPPMPTLPDLFGAQAPTMAFSTPAPFHLPVLPEIPVIALSTQSALTPVATAATPTAVVKNAAEPPQAAAQPTTTPAADASQGEAAAQPTATPSAASAAPAQAPAADAPFVQLVLPGGIRLSIVDQPAGQSNYVSTDPNAVTRYAAAEANGVIGLLAHDTLAGSNFASLKVGDVITLVDSSGSTYAYQITESRSYQALSPESPLSDFIDLSNNQKLSAAAVFNLVYSGSGQVTLQTCIAKDGDASWGRLFLIAKPVA
jgi:hypothetical protein